MIKILVNDGMHIDGQKALEAAGFQVDTDKIAQEELPTKLQEYDVIIVRSATKVRAALIDACPNLKIIARGGVGLDNIDVQYAKEKGRVVMNTPAASSESVAELAFAHLFSIARFLHHSNREMPVKGDSEFKALKKIASKGYQLRGKKLGIIGFGRIGQETARIGLGLGMEIMAVDLIVDKASIKISEQINQAVEIQTVNMDDMLANADFISLHVPSSGKPIIGKEEIDKMKSGVVLVNTARGGSIDEAALLEGLESGKVSAAGLDVFANEPSPRKDILEHDKISLSAHIGGSTKEAQRNIGLELAEKIIGHFAS